MYSEFQIFQKFPAVETAEYFSDFLKKNNIDSKVEPQANSGDVNFQGRAIDFEVAVKIDPKDFAKANLLLDNYYALQTEQVDEDYYLLKFTDKELMEIISQPFEWGHFDYQLAKKMLKEKGYEISDQHIEKTKNNILKEMSGLEKVNPSKIIAGYILSIVLPFVGFILGQLILLNKKTLPDGSVIFTHDEKDRKHAKRIVLLSAVSFFLLIAVKLFLINNVD